MNATLKASRKQTARSCSGQGLTSLWKMHQLISIRRASRQGVNLKCGKAKLKLFFTKILHLSNLSHLEKATRTLQVLPKTIQNPAPNFSLLSLCILALMRILDLYKEADDNTITPSSISLNRKPITTPVLFLMVSNALYQCGNCCLARV